MARPDSNRLVTRWCVKLEASPVTRMDSKVVKSFEAADVGFAACISAAPAAAQGRVRPVATGCFPAAHLQGLLCGDELGRGSVIFRPELTRAR